MLGIGLAVLNIRMLAAGVTKVEMDGTEDKSGTKVVKRILRTRSAVRLGLITLIAIGCAARRRRRSGMGLVIGLVDLPDRRSSSTPAARSCRPGSGEVVMT